MKRTFIAVKIDADENLREIISDLRKELIDESIKWVDVSNMHITIAFLGDTSEENIEKVSGMLDSKCSGSGKFDFRLAGLGVFRNIHDPKVIWAGIQKPDKLPELHNIVKDGLAEIGIRIEERPFKPHLTIARVRWIKNRKSLESLIEKYKNTFFQDVQISKIIFFESRPGQTGHNYVLVKSVKL